MHRPLSLVEALFFEPEKRVPGPGSLPVDTTLQRKKHPFPL